MIERKIFQSRAEWLTERKNYIGGSDASAVVGLNPYKSSVDLWEEKTLLVTPDDISDKPFVKYGHDAEPLLRGLFALDFPEYKVEYFGDNMILNDEYPFAAASLDGELTEISTGRKGILEIKTTNILQSMQKEKWKGKIPDNYFVQVLHYLMVTEYDFAVLKAQLKYEYPESGVKLETRHYYIERSEVIDDLSYLAEEERKFWKNVEEGVRPPLRLPEI